MNRLFDIANRSSVSVYVSRFLYDKTPHLVIEVRGLFFGRAQFHAAALHAAKIFGFRLSPFTLCLSVFICGCF